MEEESEAGPGWNSVSTTDLPTPQGQRLSNLRKVSGRWAQDKKGSGPTPPEGWSRDTEPAVWWETETHHDKTVWHQMYLKNPEEAGGVMNHILEDGQLFLSNWTELNLFTKREKIHREQIYRCQRKCYGERIVEFGMNMYTLLYLNWWATRNKGKCTLFESKNATLLSTTLNHKSY